MSTNAYSMIFSLSLRKTLAYRVDFWVRFVVSVLTRVLVAYFLWTAILEASGQEALRGYTLESLLLYYSCIGVLSFVIRGADMGHISMEIFDGSLTKYLVYPVSYWRFKFVEYITLSVMYFFQMILVIGALSFFMGLPSDIPLRLSGVVMMVITGLLGAYLYFALGACLQFVAFWAEHVWSLMVLLRFISDILGGALIPLAFFPDWIRMAVAYTPFPYIFSHPVKLLMGESGFFEFIMVCAVLVAWSVLFTVIARYIWSKGSYQYSGVGM